METETIVTFAENEKYYLSAETVQNNIKYFLANKLDADEELTIEATIFEEIKYDDGYYLDEVKNEKMLHFLTAVFTSNMISEVDEM